MISMTFHNKKVLYISLFAALLIFACVCGLLLWQSFRSNSNHNIPDDRAVESIKTTVSPKTWDTMKDTIEDYTTHPLDSFTIKGVNDTMSTDKPRFIIEQAQTRVKYNVTVDPSDQEGIDYVYVTCAEPDLQYDGVECDLYTSGDE